MDWKAGSSQVRAGSWHLSEPHVMMECHCQSGRQHNSQVTRSFQGRSLHRSYEFLLLWGYMTVTQPSRMCCLQQYMFIGGMSVELPQGPHANSRGIDNVKVYRCCTTHLWTLVVLVLIPTSIPTLSCTHWSVALMKDYLVYSRCPSHRVCRISVGITRPPSPLTSTKLRSTGGMRARIVSVHALGAHWPRMSGKGFDL